MLNGLRIKHSSLLVWTLLITATSSNKRKFKSDAKIITNLLEKIIKPYIDTNQDIVGKNSLTEENITLRVTKTEIENAIRLKVIELKPVLQETGFNNTKIETDNKLKLEGNDETTIIEVVPVNNRKANTRKTKELADAFQKKIENYKQMRQNITKLLQKVKTDNSTKLLITRTLDDMLALLIDRQCSVKNQDTGAVMNEILKDTRRSQAIQKVGKKDMASLRSWYWSPFRFLELVDQTEGIQAVLKDMQNFVYQILVNSWNVIDSYRISCSLKRKDSPGEMARSRRFDRDSKNSTQCDGLLICTAELSAFLTKIYKILNGTAVGTFRTYLAMYMRDVKTTENIEDNIVSRMLEVLKVVAEIRVHKIFMTELDHFTKDALDTKKEVNILLINKFIAGIIDQVKSGLYALVLEKLSAKNTLFSRMKDDLIINLRMDMDNLDEHITDNICDSFVMCNGKPNGNITRRFYKRNPKKDVYVQLEISLDDQLKDSLASLASRRNLNSLQGLKNMTYGIGKSLMSVIDRRRYSYVNVTRTTVSSTVTTVGSIENGIAEPFF